MTDKQCLIELAKRCEAAEARPHYSVDKVALRALNREIALAIGWVRKPPSEGRSKHPTWYHPDDCRDGRVIGDSLHGVDVWREPLDYVASIDAALTLVPREGFAELNIYNGHNIHGQPEDGKDEAIVWLKYGQEFCQQSWGATPALALTAACLWALAEEIV